MSNSSGDGAAELYHSVTVWVRELETFTFVLLALLACCFCAWCHLCCTLHRANRAARRPAVHPQEELKPLVRDGAGRV